MTIAFLLALCAVNRLSLPKKELIQIALEAENRYVGVSCGKLDQSCEVYSRKNHLLYLDTRDDSYELIPQAEHRKPYKIAVFFSGLERNLASSRYNLRVDECRSAAYVLKAYAGMEYGKFPSPEKYASNVNFRWTFVCHYDTVKRIAGLRRLSRSLFFWEAKATPTQTKGGKKHEKDESNAFHRDGLRNACHLNRCAGICRDQFCCPQYHD